MLVSGLLDTADGYLSESDRPRIAASEALNLIRDSVKLGTEAYDCLAFIRGASTDEIPYPIAPPLKRWFDNLQLPNSTFFRAELVANYELRPIPEQYFLGIRNPSASLTAAIKQVTWPFLRVTVPSGAFAIIPHLAIVAHEIGHALYTKISWDLTAFSAEGDAVKRRIMARLGVTSLDLSTQKFMSNLFSRWFQEFSADAFALYLTGPAIFFSLSELMQFRGGSYTLSDTHPASDLRLSALYERLNDGGEQSFSKLFKKHTAQELTQDFNSHLLQLTPNADKIFADAVAKKITNEHAAVLAEVHTSMPKAVQLVYDHVYAYLQANAADAIYTPDQYDKDLTDHLEPMLAAVPPIESGSDLRRKTSTEFATILNVGWAVLLTKLPDLRVKTSGADQFHCERLERLHGLLLKAVELSEAKRTWQSA